MKPYLINEAPNYSCRFIPRFFAAEVFPKIADLFHIVISDVWMDAYGVGLLSNGLRLDAT